MIYCENCKSNNSFNNWKRISNGGKYNYKCKVCVRHKLNNTKIYTRKELRLLYTNEFIG